MILIYIHRTEPLETSWVVLDSAGRIQQTKIRANLAELTPFAKNTDVTVIVPAEDVLLISAELPKLNRQRLLTALPFALEERLIGDVDELHFAAVDYQPDNTVPTAITSQKKMTEWLKILTDAGIEPSAMIPATLALPFTPNHWHVYLDSTLAMVRTGKYSGFTSERENLAELIALKVSEEGKPECIDVQNASKQPLDIALSDSRINETKISETPFLEDIAAEIHTLPVINLLQNAYRPKTKTTKTKKIWLAAAGLLAVFFAITIASNGVSYFILAQQNKKIDSEIKQIYFRQFPSATSVVEPRQRLEAKLKKISAETEKNLFFSLLGRIGKALPDAPNTRLIRLDFREKTLNLAVSSDTFDHLDAFTRALTREGLRVTQKNAATTDKQVKANLLIEAGEQ